MGRTLYLAFWAFSLIIVSSKFGYDRGYDNAVETSPEIVRAEMERRDMYRALLASNTEDRESAPGTPEDACETFFAHIEDFADSDPERYLIGGTAAYGPKNREEACGDFISTGFEVLHDEFKWFELGRGETR